MYCSVCVELSNEADGEEVYVTMGGAITQVNGTLFCYKHAKLFFEKMRADRNDKQKLFESLDKL